MQLGQSSVLQLTNPLACDAKMLADLLKRLFLLSVEAEAANQNLHLPSGSSPMSERRMVLMFLSDNSRSGKMAFSSDTNSPNWGDDSSPTGESSEAGRMAARRMSAILAGGTPNTWPSSRSVRGRAGRAG